MRTVRLVIAALLLLILMVLMAANMTPVELHLLPPKFDLGLPSLKSVPVALIIVCSVLFGIVIGFLMEFARERKHRVKLDQKRAEVGALQDENRRLAKRLERHGDEIGVIGG